MVADAHWSEPTPGCLAISAVSAIDHAKLGRRLNLPEQQVITFAQTVGYPRSCCRSFRFCAKDLATDRFSFGRELLEGV